MTTSTKINTNNECCLTKKKASLVLQTLLILLEASALRGTDALAFRIPPPVVPLWKENNGCTRSTVSLSSFLCCSSARTSSRRSVSSAVSPLRLSPSPSTTENKSFRNHLTRRIREPRSLVLSSLSGSLLVTPQSVFGGSLSSVGSPLCWFGSSLLGYFVEKRILPESGILVTLAASALTVTRPTPALNELCWGTFLPASLALLLLSIPEQNQSMKQQQVASGEDKDDDDYTIAKSIRRLTIPFVLASVGSILGCGIAFWMCHAWHLGAPSWLLAPAEARIALSCLVASFVGGSVNFFATANAIASVSSSSCSKNTVTTIASSMATSDIIVMAIYFAFIGAAVSSDKMKSFFGRNRRRVRGKEEGNDDCGVPGAKVPTNDSLLSIPPSTNEQEEKQINHVSALPMKRAIRAGIFASSLAWTMVRFAVWTERRLDGFVPGLACAVLATMTPLVRRILRRWSCCRTSGKPEQRTWYSDMQRVSVPLSQVSFLLLFSSIGSTADLKQAARSGLACLVVSMVALAIHFVVVLVGSVLVSRQRISSSSVWTDLDWEDVLVASNAAIGGPATAAAFCGRIQSRPKEGIAYAGTFWGVVGYAIGTTLGVLAYRVSGFLLPRTCL